MKLKLPNALVVAVTPIGENHGEEIVTAVSVRVETKVLPEMLDEIEAGLREKLCDGDKVRIPSIESYEVKYEFENAQLLFGDLMFKDGKVSKIKIAPTQGGVWDFAASFKVTPNDEESGHLVGLIKRRITVVAEKMTLVPDKPPKGSKKADPRQGKLVDDAGEAAPKPGTGARAKAKTRIKRQMAGAERKGNRKKNRGH